ncbi:PREDICTED: uncharacterized protein LOC109479120 [Branchiostoma belcheri]|uniref:Uncharacterized protein LOC109479120 n=1 Tax=Branchiostoma belcheri TaxID=7741 RepID=A0A6P4ZR35_BRABE|nr:PREDICTED: uncharacterized protein LOC109479120 [Branchiostoma belcheri]
MAILKDSCCSCCNLRGLSIFVGILFANLHLTDLSLKAMSIRPGSQVYGLPAAGIAIDVLAILILMCALMIHGVQKGKKVMLLVWVVFVVIILVVKLIIAIAITVLVTIAAEVAARSYYFRYVNISAIPIEEIEAKVLAQVWAIYIVTLLLTIYGVLVVYSHYRNLRYGVLDDDGIHDGAAPPPGALPPGTAAPPPGGMYPQAAAPPPGYEKQYVVPPKV